MAFGSGTHLTRQMKQKVMKEGKTAPGVFFKRVHLFPLLIYAITSLKGGMRHLVPNVKWANCRELPLT